MSRQHISLLLTLLLGVFMGALDIFIVAPALEPIQHGLHVSARVVTWSFTAYTLILVVTQPLVGKLADLRGRRTSYLVCVALFGLGSLLCALATGFGPFLLGRGLQAMGAGGILPLASAVIADTFPPAKRGAALGIVGSVFGLAFIIGPLLGSALTGGLQLGGLVTDWRAIFLVNLPLVVIILCLAARTIPARPAQTIAQLHFDGNGALLLALALFCVILGLSQINFMNLTANLTNEAALPCVVLGVALLFPFWLNEQRVPDPIIAPRLIGRRQILLALALSIGAGMVTSSIVYIPQLAGAVLRLTRPGAGGVFLVWVALTLTVGTPLTGRLLDRVGSRTVLQLGASVTALAFVLLFVAGHTAGGLISALLLLGFGLSTFVGTPLRYMIVNEAPADRRGATLALLTVCNSVGQTLVLPLGGAFLASSGASDSAIALGLRLFYLVVLAVVVMALLITLGLKTRQQEQPPHQAMVPNAPPRPRSAPAEREAEPSLARR